MRGSNDRSEGFLRKKLRIGVICAGGGVATLGATWSPFGPSGTGSSAYV